MPRVGLGTWKLSAFSSGGEGSGGGVAAAVHAALRAGYRHLDCACDYGNEAGVGEGIRRALADGTLKTRAELFVTSKLWNTYHAPDHVPAALQRSLDDLGLDYLDLYLVHFPIALEFVPFEESYPPSWERCPGEGLRYARVPMQATWGAMEDLLKAPPSGVAKVRNIGLCNVNCAGLRDLLSYARVVPAVLQVERHVYLQQPELLRFCATQGIVVEAFSPLGSSSYVELGMASAEESALSDPVVVAVAAKHPGATPAQVLLAWGLQSGPSSRPGGGGAAAAAYPMTAVVPKASSPGRMAENLSCLDLELDGDDLTALSALDRHKRFNDPAEFTQGMGGSFCPIYD